MLAPGPTPSDEQELDDILGAIDRLVDHQCKKATERRASPAPPAPTQAFSPSRYKKTQMAFQQLSESKLELNDSRSDQAALPAEDSDEPEQKQPPTKSIWPWSKAATG
jgi:hypothetical protein